MSVTINGTSGVTTPGIANSEGYTGDGLTIAAGAPAGAITINSTYQTFSPNGSEAMRLDASGNLGLGVAPRAWQTSVRAFDIAGGSNAGALYSGAGVQLGAIANAYYLSGVFYYKVTAAASDYRQEDGGHKWYTAPSGTAGNPITFTQAMTLDASGNLLVGPTLPTLNGVVTIAQRNVSGAGSTGMCINNVYANNKIIDFGWYGTSIGSISQNGSSVFYNNSSDYRLKENIQPMTGALEKIVALKPCTFNWRLNGLSDRGFIAHELQEIIPQAVSGEKDAVNEDGSIKPQGVDYGKITPELVAAIQEQQAMINELKTRIEQLEAK